MKTLILLFSILAFALAHIQKPGNGLEIYQVKKTYPDFTKKQQTRCCYCLDIESKDLYDKPLLTEKDFKKYDWASQQIELVDEARQRIDTLSIPLQGLPVAMVLNGEVVYGFWFWNEVSSFGCDRVYTYPALDFKIKFGLPVSNTFGNDPRFDERLEKYIKEMK